MFYSDKPCYKQEDFKHLPLAEKTAAAELSLPLFADTTKQQTQHVMDALNAY